MKSIFGGTLLVAAVTVNQAIFGQQFLLIPESGSDTIGTYSPVDGSLIDANFIVDAADPTTYDFGTPKEAIQVGNEIWITDQIEDAVFIFDLAGNYLAKIGQDNVGDPTGDFDNIRGLALFGNTVYVSNAGSDNGAPGDAIVTVNALTRGVTGSFVVTNPATGDVTDPFDVEVYGDNLLISDIEGGVDGDGFDLVAPDGTYVSRLVSSDGVNGIDFPQQGHAKFSDSNFLAAGFSPPDGLYEYNSAGSQVAFFPDTAGRGVFELQNGNYLYTSGAGTFVLNTATGGSTLVGPGTQYISLVVVPEPTALALLGAATLLALGLRQRR